MPEQRTKNYAEQLLERQIGGLQMIVDELETIRFRLGFLLALVLTSAIMSLIVAILSAI